MNQKSVDPEVGRYVVQLQRDPTRLLGIKSANLEIVWRFIGHSRAATERQPLHCGGGPGGLWRTAPEYGAGGAGLAVRGRGVPFAYWFTWMNCVCWQRRRRWRWQARVWRRQQQLGGVQRRRWRLGFGRMTGRESFHTARDSTHAAGASTGSHASPCAEGCGRDRSDQTSADNPLAGMVSYQTSYSSRR